LTRSRAKTNRAAGWAVIATIVGSSLPASWAQAPDNPHSGHAAMAAGGMPPPTDDGVLVDFTLVDRDGNTVTDEDFRGRYVLLGFGFTHCEHICPLMALNMGRVVGSAAKPATGIFVSVDTERDSAAISDDYAQHFGASMLGLGGNIEQINAAARNFKVSYAVTKTQDHYTVQHTANVFLIDPRGELVDVFAFSDGPDRILEAMD
jgi:protein SCO1/2